MHTKHDYFFSDFKDIVIWQLLVKKWNFFGGVVPFSPFKSGQPGKMAAHECLWPPLFMSKSYNTIKMTMFYEKKLDQKILIFGRMTSNFVRSTFFWVELPTNKSEIAIWGQTWLLSWFLGGGHWGPPHGSHRIWYAMGDRVNVSPFSNKFGILIDVNFLKV